MGVDAPLNVQEDVYNQTMGLEKKKLSLKKTSNIILHLCLLMSVKGNH
jgi:hypothetical protein